MSVSADPQVVHDPVFRHRLRFSETTDERGNPAVLCEMWVEPGGGCRRTCSHGWRSASRLSKGGWSSWPGVDGSTRTPARRPSSRPARGTRTATAATRSPTRAASRPARPGARGLPHRRRRALAQRSHHEARDPEGRHRLAAGRRDARHLRRDGRNELPTRPTPLPPAPAHATSRPPRQASRHPPREFHVIQCMLCRRVESRLLGFSMGVNR